MAEALEGLRTLGAACAEVLEETIASPESADLAAAYAFGTELEAWRTALAGRPELTLFDTAHSEFLIGMLNAAQGQYRNAFKCLRLVLELHLQGVALSTDLLALKEWLASDRLTVWAQLVGLDGVFGTRMVKAFFPDLGDNATMVRSEAERLYKALSECIHGNVPVDIPLPETIRFSGPSLRLWLTKADAVRRVIHFSLTLRYLRELGDGSDLELVLTDVLGDIAPVRSFFGGRTE